MKNNRRKAGAGRGTLRQEGTPATTMLSALIEKPNVWSDWFPNMSISPLSWIRMAALLMRDTPVEPVIDRLAPLLEKTRLDTADFLVRFLKNVPDYPEILVTYEFYRDRFQDALLHNYPMFLETLEGSEDLNWLRDHLMPNPSGSESFVWFLLNGIATARMEGMLDRKRVKPASRWLADLDFYEPAAIAGDEIVMRASYKTFRKNFSRAAPLPDMLVTASSPTDPLLGEEDEYMRRLMLIESRQTRLLALERDSSSDPDDAPVDGWRRDMRVNPWQRVLDIARVPAFHWQRQVAFMLRGVPLDEVALGIERALLDMADVTGRNCLEYIADRGRGPSDIVFGLWFRFWAEHFRHWHDPLRTELEQLCGPGDAELVKDWLPRFDPTVFADFLITCSHARAIENRFGFKERDERLLASELFAVDPDLPLRPSGIYQISRQLWHRFREANGVPDYREDQLMEFGIDWNIALAQDQRYADARL